MALKKVKGNFERMFDKNLTDLVRGIRNNKDNESKYIAQCMEEIKVELRQDNIAVKANAVAKLTYLQMLGYDISWAIFNIIEVMSSNKFTYKRIGYLAASQSFHADSELLMLTTNMIRKDLNAQNQYEAGLALSGLSCFISHDLARDLANDIMTLMSSTKPYLRMKAVLMMYKVFLRYPEALRPAFPKLKEKLEDPDPGVQSAAVNVVCELARKNPKNYLSLAPVFFKLMTTSTNNWMLIKIIKLFGALTPLEPRLGKKLIEPLTNLIHSTSAMSLLYECINTVIAVLISISSGMPGHAASVQLCVQKLRILIEDSDQNLKYLGLLAMSRILKSHPKSVQAHKDLVLACLDDKDESIRLRALGLLYGMVSKKNLMEIVKKLMVHMDRAEGTLYRDELLTRIIEICSQNNYQHVVDFECEESVMRESVSGLLICAGTGGGHMRARAVCVHAALKIVANLLRLYEGRNDLEAAIALLYSNTYCYRDDLEKEDNLDPINGESSSPGFSGGLIEELADLFDGELKPVAPKAQKKVPMPADLNLEQWLSHDHWSSESSSSEGEAEAAVFAAPQKDARPTAQFTPEELAMLREARRQEQANNPHYLKDDSPRSYQQDDIPIAEIALDVPLQVHTKRSDKYLLSRENSSKKKKEKRTSKKRKSKKDKPSSDSDSEEEASLSRPAVAEGGELPEGAALSDEEPAPPPDDPHRALDLDLDQPLREEELLTSRINQYPSPEGGLLTKKSKSSKKNKYADKGSGDKASKKKKEKKSKQKSVDLMLPEVAKDEVEENLLIDDLSQTNGKKSAKGSEVEEAILVEPHPKGTKTEKHKKSKKESKDKDSKRNKSSSKKGKHDKKTGYEEALGISTPSKEVI
ncbi:hypothetical protein HF086_001248 [Spodoptera exigua]|uniref:AP-3 complex subunit delta n=1 Tax=Spodoptera exigua TaxID=7107 RepID=A0A922MC63_SPOEX|nr:hypothetical protein HF086_001248 [Spodoptera exigua]